jgi:hypothetical protein
VAFYKHMNDWVRSHVPRRFKVWIRSKVSWCHAYVLSYEYESVSNPSSEMSKGDPSVDRVLERARRLHANLELKQITISDINDIDELTEKDVWNIPKSLTLEMLQDGWLCYVAKYKNQIVANVWKKTGPEFYESYFHRSFTLTEEEVYEGRAFCVPNFKGKGVILWLMDIVNKQLAITAGIKRHTGWVKNTNEAMFSTLAQRGHSVVGRVGFIDIFGVRLHYLWGRKAFSATRKRFFIQR